MNKRERYDSLFQFYGQQYGVEWRLLKSQAIQESGLDPDAINPHSQARGLAQFMERTWQEWRDGTAGIDTAPPTERNLFDPRDPEDAIKSQAAYLAWLLVQLRGDIQLALAAYNWGIGNVKRNPASESWPIETQKYVPAILDRWKEDAQI